VRERERERERIEPKEEEGEKNTLRIKASAAGRVVRRDKKKYFL
jgi:hypothetical protein